MGDSLPGPGGRGNAYAQVQRHVGGVSPRVGGGSGHTGDEDQDHDGGMAPGVSRGTARMRPPTAIYRRPDTGFPERGKSGADFRGWFAAYARACVGPTDPSCPNPYSRPYSGPYREGLQTPLQPPIRRPVQGSVQRPVRGSDGDQEHGGGGGSPREVPGRRRQHRKSALEGEKPPNLRIGHANTGVGAYRARSSSSRIAYRIRAADLHKRNGGARLFTAHKVGLGARAHPGRMGRPGCAPAQEAARTAKTASDGF